jgi:hypothetical protein
MLVMKNNLVACLPFSNDVSKQARGALALIDCKNILIGLKVVVGNEEYREGDTVLVRSDRSSHPWAKEKFTSDRITEVVEEKPGEIKRVKIEFILVPTAEIVAKEDCAPSQAIPALPRFLAPGDLARPREHAHGGVAL